MGELADLIGAVRLPTGAHRRAAGTDVVTDLLVFRRREPDGAAGRRAAGRPRAVDRRRRDRCGSTAYFDRAPRARCSASSSSAARHVRRRHAARSPATSTARRSQLADTLERRSPRPRAASGLVMSDRRRVREARRAVAEPSRAGGVWDGHDRRRARAAASLRSPDGAQERATASAQAGCARAARAAWRCATAPAAAGVRRRRALEDTAGDRRRCARGCAMTTSDYSARYGPINRFTLRRTGRIDPETGEERPARGSRRRRSGCCGRPVRAAGDGLEVFDEETQTARAGGDAARARRRTARAECSAPTARRTRSRSAWTPRPRRPALRSRGCSAATSREARADARRAGLHRPRQRRARPAAEYLSGDVRDKLEQRPRGRRPSDATFAGQRRRARAACCRPTSARRRSRPRLGAVWISERGPRRSSCARSSTTATECGWSTRGGHVGGPRRPTTHRSPPQRVGHRAAWPAPDDRQGAAGAAHRFRSPTRRGRDGTAAS